MKIIRGAIVAVATICMTVPALADYPERPITVIVPASPGGGTDVGVRTWTPFLEKCIGGSTVVVNKPGAGHMIGLVELAKAAPDGYTIGAVTLPNMIVSAEKGGYSPDSFDFVGSFYGSLGTVTVRADSKYNSLRQVIDDVKASGQPLKLGIASIASDDHLTGLQLAELAGIKIEFVPLGDAAPVRNALLGGHIEVVSLSYTETVPFSDQLKVLAITGDARQDKIKDTPTFKELGYDLLGGSRHTIGAPKGLPADVAAKLTECLDKIAVDPEFLKVTGERALIVNPMSGPATADYVRKNFDTVIELKRKNPWE